MKISELLEKLGELQGVHGDVNVYIGDRYRDDELLEKDDAVQNIEFFPKVWRKRLPGSAVNEPCIVLFNY